jgi:hypothetical protein
MEDSDNTVPLWPFRVAGKGQAIAATTASSSITIAAGERFEDALIANLSMGELRPRRRGHRRFSDRRNAAARNCDCAEHVALDAAAE